MIKLKSITQHSWLVLTEGDFDRIGLLSEQRDKLVLIAGVAKTEFKNRDEVKQFFSGDVFANVIETETTETGKQFFIKGYPVDFDRPVEVDGAVVGSKLPLYSKTAKSTTHYSAGYYCLMFPKCWQPASCPKLATLEKYEYIGPFKTEQEMKHRLAEARRNDTRHK